MSDRMPPRKKDAPASVPELKDRFFDLSIDMLCCLDFSGYFKRLNPAWERTLGYTVKSSCPGLSSNSCTPTTASAPSPRTRGRSGGQALGFENRYMCKDG